MHKTKVLGSSQVKVRSPGYIEHGVVCGGLSVDTGKRLVQLTDAGSPPYRAAAPHGPQFRLLVLKEDEDKDIYINQASNKPIEERSVRSRAMMTCPRHKSIVDGAVDCPVEVPAWLIGLCGFLGDLPCWMPRGAVTVGKGAGCDWAPCFSHRLDGI